MKARGEGQRVKVQQEDFLSEREDSHVRGRWLCFFLCLPLGSGELHLFQFFLSRQQLCLLPL